MQVWVALNNIYLLIETVHHETVLLQLFIHSGKLEWNTNLVRENLLLPRETGSPIFSSSSSSLMSTFSSSVWLQSSNFTDVPRLNSSRPVVTMRDRQKVRNRQNCQDFLLYKYIIFLLVQLSNSVLDLGWNRYRYCLYLGSIASQHRWANIL